MNIVDTLRRWPSRSDRHFFGLAPDDKFDLILEPAFLLMYYGGFLYQETYNMPVVHKRWFIERLVKELNRGKEGENPPTRALHQNNPELREMQGMNRAQAPSRLRRFT